MPTVINYKEAKELFLSEISDYLIECRNKFFKGDGLARAGALQTYLNTPENNQNIHVLVALLALFETTSKVLAEKLVNKLITEDTKGKGESPIFEQESLDNMMSLSSGGDRRLTLGGIEDKIHIAKNLLLQAGVRCGLTINVPKQKIDLTHPDIIAERSEVYKITVSGEAVDEAERLNIDNELTKLQETVPSASSSCVLL